MFSSRSSITVHYKNKAEKGLVSEYYNIKCTSNELEQSNIKEVYNIFLPGNQL